MSRTSCRDNQKGDGFLRPETRRFLIGAFASNPVPGNVRFLRQHLNCHAKANKSSEVAHSAALAVTADAGIKTFTFGDVDDFKLSNCWRSSTQSSSFCRERFPFCQAAPGDEFAFLTQIRPEASSSDCARNYEHAADNRQCTGNRKKIHFLRLLAVPFSGAGASRPDCHAASDAFVYHDRQPE